MFSSFEIYGWKQRDEQYATLFNQVHPNLTFHGTQSNETVRAFLQESHFFAYPCIWPETSCIAAIEAMAAGCGIVCPDLAALSETVIDKTYQYRFDENIQTHAQKFYETLKKAISNQKNTFTSQAEQANMKYSWSSAITKWSNLIGNPNGPPKN